MKRIFGMLTLMLFIFPTHSHAAYIVDTGEPDFSNGYGYGYSSSQRDNGKGLIVKKDGSLVNKKSEVNSFD